MGTRLDTGSQAALFDVTSGMSTSKKCRKCQTDLHDLNWSPSRQWKHDYICNVCLNKNARKYDKKPHTSGTSGYSFRQYVSHDQYEFRGVDGEGGNVPDDASLFGEVRHQYLSLRAGPDLLATGRPLHWEECLSFLADLPKRHIYVAYFFDYDVTMIIRTFPEERARRLMNRHQRTNKQNGNLLPLDIGEFQVDYLPHKEFKVRRKGATHWTIINDVGQFFQSAFVTTLEKWQIGTPVEREMIRKGKSMRSEFTEHNAEIEAYNALECLLLEQLMTEFRSVCWETGYVPKKWQGPGNLASAMLTKHAIPKRDDIPILKNDQFRALAQEAYYGGRFETTSVGPVHGPVYQYDINGAYVAALRGLPCLTHGSWKHVTSEPDKGLYFGRIHFNHDPAYLYSFPVRDKKGNIMFPRQGNGVYWSDEIAAARRNDASVSFKEGWVYESHCECRWFDFVDDYYQLRLSLGKTNKGYVLKLAGNSIYGKLAQSIGYAPWANPVWAGIITASCRAQIIDAYRQAPQDTYMIATDGIFTGKPLDLTVSRELGEWDLTVHPDGIFIVQPGIYFAGSEPKSRGVERGKIHDMRGTFEQQFTKFRESKGIDYTVKVPVTNFITAKQALARNKWALAGTWETTERDISFWWANKRVSGMARWDDGNLRTLPHRGGADLESVGYTRIIGGGLFVPDDERYTDPSLAEAARAQEQPDWVQPLFSE